MSNELPISVCKVETPEGSKHYVTILPVEAVFSQGIAPEALVGILSEQWEPTMPLTPDVFARNSVFVEFLHTVIARHAPNQPSFQAEAQRLGNGWVYVIDQRTPTPKEAVPPEDILGAFKVSNGVAVPDSYQQSSKHRLLSQRGFFRLGSELQECLLRELAVCNSGNSADDGRGATVASIQ